MHPLYCILFYSIVSTLLLRNATGDVMHKIPPESSPMEQAPTSSSVIITLSARDLRDIDINSVSDPFCVVSKVVSNGMRSKKMEEVGRTEIVNNCLDPDWSTKVRSGFHRRQDQRLKFEVFHKGPPNKHQLLGSATAILDDIVDARFNRLTLPLFYDGKHRGSLIVTAEEIKPGRQESVYFVVSATNLDRKDFLGKCDPFLKISRINYDETLQLAYRTRYREQNLNPKWKPFEIAIDQLCYGDKDRDFLIECFDWDQDGNHDLVGACVTSVNKLVTHRDTSLKLVHMKKARKSKKYSDSGILHFQKVYCWFDHTYHDFLNAGTELEFMMGVCFPPTWHDNRVHADQYDAAIRSIAEIFSQFQVHTRAFEAYGLGGRDPHDRSNHSIFPLNTETGVATCDGVQGLLYAYHHARKSLELTGHHHFSPLIRLAAQMASRHSADGKHYTVLILITDGMISDLDRTKQEIVKASCLPLSIIIVGVGYDSFEEMKLLDSDDSLLSYNGKSARRDIVQFVELRKFLPPHRKLTELESVEAKKELEKEVLQELPLQLTSYMKSKGICPRSMAAGRVSHSAQGRRHPPARNTFSDNVPGTPRIRRQLPKVPTADVQQKLRIQ